MKNTTNTNSFASTRRALGSRLFSLAVRWSRVMPGTQKERRDVIKGIKGRKKIIDGSKGIDAARLAVELAADKISEARMNRRPIPAFLISRNRGRAAVKLPRGTLEQRRQRLVKSDFLDSMNSVGYRFERDPTVVTTTAPANVRVDQADYLDWNYYSKSCRYPKKIVDTTFTIPLAWRTRVLQRGLAVVDGLTTLDAARLEGAPDGVELYAAKWVQQGRGYALEAVRGYIAMAGGVAYHAETPEKAITGARRKAGIRAANAALDDLLKRHGIDALVAQYPDLSVTVNDARMTGSCEYGIKSWCATTGLDYSAGVATLAEVYDAYRRHPMPEARAAILQAMRRQRRAVISAAA